MTCEAIIVNHPRNRENSANGEAHLANAEKKVSSPQEPVTCNAGQCYCRTPGPSRPGLAGSCDSRGVRLQDVLFPAYCTLQRHIREGRPDGLSTLVVVVSPGNKIKTVRRDLSTLR